MEKRAGSDMETMETIQFEVRGEVYDGDEVIEPREQEKGKMEEGKDE